MIEAILIMVGTGLVSAVGLGVAGRFFAVEVDPRVTKVAELLPGANCGGCGSPGCQGYADALVARKADINACPVCSPDNRRLIADLLGMEYADATKRQAVVHCQGTRAMTHDRFAYQGVPSCAAANQLGGQLSCRYGCLGFGDCARACPFGAMVVENGVARVIEERCTACGKCVAACPRALIDLQPGPQQVHVLCRNRDRGKMVSVACKVGCIACAKCVKTCPVEAIAMVDGVAVIDADKCIACGACARACPTKSIVDRAGPHFTAHITENCTGCTLCSRVCPAGAIAGEKKQRHVVDVDKCVRCHKSHAVCNFEAIEMLDDAGAVAMPPRPKKAKKAAEPAAKESA